MAENNSCNSQAAEQPTVEVKKTKWYKNPLFWFLVFVILGLVGYNAYFRVPARHVGVADTQGKTDTVWYSGPHLKMPLLTTVYLYDIGIQRFDYRTGGDSLKTKTLVKMQKFSAIVQYSLVGSEAVRLYNNVGTAEDFRDKVLAPVVSGIVHQIIGMFEPEYLVYNQATVKEDLLKIIRDEIGQTKLAEISSLQITGFKFDDKFETANLDVAIAEKIAEKVLIEAKANAEALGLESNAITNPVYIKYLYAKAFGQWRGDVPSTLMVGNDVLSGVLVGGKK